MRWISHIAIAGSICAVFNPVAVPAAVLGSTAPDWFEMVKNAFSTRKKVKHRAATHYLVAWIGLALFARLIWDFQGWLFWFALGGAIHWFCDALTVSGAPVGWWSDRRVTLFGGKVYTGSPAEYVITGIIVTVCAIFIWARSSTPGGFIPFFYHWGEHYEEGLIDGHEWKTNRFNLI
jgi:inner membrane protein